MPRKKKTLILTTDRLEPKGASALDEKNQRWLIPKASVGDQVRVMTGRKRKARLLEVITPHQDSVPPPCSLFGVCGGCQLQTMPLPRQQEAKRQMVQRVVDAPTRIISSEQSYGWRNRMEFSFGKRVFTLGRKEEIDPNVVPSYLGLHPRGWHSKIVNIEHCYLMSPDMNAVLALVQSLKLTPIWDQYTQTGVWRHLILRQGEGLLVGLVTSSQACATKVQQVANAISSLPRIQGIVHIVTDNRADVAMGQLQAVLYGSAQLSISLLNKQFLIPHDAFFQVNTIGAEKLIQTIQKLLPKNSKGTLLDLCCGTGSLGICLADSFDKVIGIEIHPQAVALAKKNAHKNHVDGEWLVGPIEDILPSLPSLSSTTIIVDPPRAGLHPKASQFLAQQNAKLLLYIACNPASLARDRMILESGGWKLIDLCVIDLFPQTPHTESIAKFVRSEE